MKKFLSLVLALVMTMSLVTISAGAVEYKDLKDKNEITYAEAVAVMNKIGIISGYEDGTFKPTDNLTRGAAAKIITYLMVGATAGEQLGVANKPYKDVAQDSAFAPYIAYCKSTGLINGYSDGTFRPGAPLDGYSFSKMLLTALGYKSVNEGFVGSGWQTNVARLAVKSGLYTGNDGFVGSKIVTREEACLYSLNLLESITIEYLGQPNTVTTTDGTKVEVGYQPASKVVMANETTAHDYNSRNLQNGGGYVEFCEVHYPQLKLTDTGATDDFYRPSNQWAYKNAIVGTYAIDADFTFTKGTGDSSEDADYNAKEFGLKGYHFGNASNVGVVAKVNGEASTLIKTCKDLATLTGNGIVVELFLSATDANVITDVVVIKTQLMKVNAINATAKTVTLKNILTDGEHNGVNVATVKEDDAGYAALSAMKVDDLVLITYAKVGGNYVVTDAVAPTVVTGKLSKVTTKSNGTTVKGVTVAGTDYAMSAMWNSADKGLAPSSVSTKTDTTVYVDSFGYAIYVKDFTASTSYIIYDDYYSTVVDGKIHYFANGYDLNGDALSLDFGTNAGSLPALGRIGKPCAYKSSTANGGEYQLDTAGQVKVMAVPAGAIASNDVMMVVSGTRYFFAPNLKFVFAGMNGADLDGVTVKDGVQAIAAANVGGAEFVLNKDGAISTVVIHNDKDVEVSKNVLYVSAYEGSTTVANKTVSRFTAYIDGVKTKGCVSTKDNGPTMGDKFYTYSVNADGNYVLNNYNQTGKTTSVLSSATFVNSAANVKEKTYVLEAFAADGSKVTNLNAKNAVIVDLTSPSMNLTSFKDMAEVAGGVYTVSMVFNDSTSGNGKGTVSYMFVHNATGIQATQLYVSTAATANVDFFTDAACTVAVDANDGSAADTYTKFMAGDKLYAKSKANLGAVAVTGGTVKALERATEATSKPIYEITLTGSITAATGTTGWAAATVTSATVNTKADFTGTVIANGGYVAFGETLYAKGGALKNVTISGGTGATTKLYSARPTAGTDVLTYELKVGTSAPAIAVADAWKTLTPTVGGVGIYKDAACTQEIATEIYVIEGDKFFVKSATALKKITASVVDVGAVQKTPTEATGENALASYEFTVKTADITDTSFDNTVAGWFEVVTDKGTAGKGVSAASITTDKAIYAVGDVVTVTVALQGIVTPSNAVVTIEATDATVASYKITSATSDIVATADVVSGITCKNGVNVAGVTFTCQYIMVENGIDPTVTVAP